MVSIGIVDQLYGSLDFDTNRHKEEFLKCGRNSYSIDRWIFEYQKVQKWSWAILPKSDPSFWFVATATKVVIQLYLKIRKER